MANSNEGSKEDKNSNEPEAETLKPREGSSGVDAQSKPESKAAKHAINEPDKHKRRFAFRPSHKATFIGLVVVIAILAINAAVLTFLLKSESTKNKSLTDKGVSISPSTLSKLGVNDSQVGNSGEKLTVGPAAQFNSQLTVAGNVSIGGQLKLNSTFNATGANISQLQSSNITVNSINVNNNTTTSTLSTRGNLSVSGTAQFQNTLTVGQLLSVGNSAAIARNLSVGGNVTAGSISTGSLALSGSLQIGGHLITVGSTPSVGPGGALGSNGSVSISGNDSAGTVTFNTGVGTTSGTVAKVAFSSAYSRTPVIVITSIGASAYFYLSNVSSYGFYINVGSTLGYGGYSIDYIVEQS